MSSHLNHSPLSSQQRRLLADEAKAHAHGLREEALDEAWSTLRAWIGRTTQHIWPALSSQSRTHRKEASHAKLIVTRRVQNRPRGPLRLMDP